MKIALFYYSISGNTLLACKYLKKQIPNIELIDILNNPKTNVEDYDLVGIATSTFYLNSPPIVNEFISSLKEQSNKPLFILVTFGMMYGKVLTNVEKAMRKKGYRTIDYHALRMPESYPVFIVKNMTDLNAPNKKEFDEFKSFINILKKKIELIENNKDVEKKKIKIGFWNYIIPAPHDKKIMKDFGSIFVDKTLCNSCKICYNSCPYNAIRFSNIPSFDMDKCKGCFICYNKCPKKAIYTSKLKGVGHYNKLPQELTEKFK